MPSRFELRNVCGTISSTCTGLDSSSSRLPHPNSSGGSPPESRREPDYACTPRLLKRRFLPRVPSMAAPWAKPLDIVSMFAIAVEVFFAPHVVSSLSIGVP